MFVCGSSNLTVPQLEFDAEDNKRCVLIGTFAGIGFTWTKPASLRAAASTLEWWIINILITLIGIKQTEVYKYLSCGVRSL